MIAGMDIRDEPCPALQSPTAVLIWFFATNLLLFSGFSISLLDRIEKKHNEWYDPLNTNVNM